MKTSFALATIAAAVLLTASNLRADVWVEVPDAGQTIGTGQATGVVGGNPLTQIFGSLSSPGDVDLFRISIDTPSTFSATTVNALTTASGLDTQLYLFTDSGAAVYANDDDSGGLSQQSTLPANNLFSPLAPGFYWLAIATSGAEPVNFSNTLLFGPDSPTFTIRGPGVNIPGGLSNWDIGAADQGVGAYQIDLTSTNTAVPEPSTWSLLALGLLGTSFFARRRKAATSNIA